MNALIEREFDFQAALYFENSFLINLYNFTVYMEVVTDSVHEQNVAMERIKYLVFELLENAVFVNQEETEIIKKYQDAGLKVCTIPEDPYDQIVALLLMLKFDTVCEGRLKVTDITFTSKLSDQVKFKENLLTAQSVYTDSDWYTEPTPNINGNQTKKVGKIVKIKNNGWKDLGLSWKEKTEKPTQIIFTTDTDK